MVPCPKNLLVLNMKIKGIQINASFSLSFSLLRRTQHFSPHTDFKGSTDMPL